MDDAARAQQRPRITSVIRRGRVRRVTEGEESVRDRMVRGAVELFGERGFSATGLREVVAHTGTPRGSIYHHVPGGKAELARAALDRAGEAAAAPFRHSDDPIAALRACLDGWRRALMACDYRAGSAMLAIAVEAREPDGIGSVAAVAYTQWVDAFTASLRAAGVRRKKAGRLATLGVAAIEGAVALCRVRRDTSALDDVGRELEAAIEAARRR
jgi:AcrR family transcriptional regulator